MPEEKVVTPPAESQGTGGNKASDITELNSRFETLEKQIKDKEAMIGRQSNEIGELRSKLDSINKAPTPEQKDELIDSLIQDLKSDGLDDETAKYNAKLLSKAGSRIIDKKLNERMLEDVIDKIDEALEDGRLDSKAFAENQNEIMAEFKSRKLDRSARKNFKTFKDCYETVIRRKADVLKTEQQKKEEAERNKTIGAGSIPQGSEKPIPSDSQEDTLKAIRNAGSSKNSVFF